MKPCIAQILRKMNVIMATLLLCCCVASLVQMPVLAQAQDFPFVEPQFERVSDGEALDSMAITALAQDTRGLIWIGTQHGLIRYDGYHFRKFVHNGADPRSLAGDFVSALYATRDGRMWVGMVSGGISVFDPGSEQFEHFRPDANIASSLGGGRIWALAEDAQGGVWIASEQGLNYWPGSGQRFTRFRHEAGANSLMDDKVRSLLWDKTNRLWVGGSQGLQRMAKDGKSFETMVSKTNVQTLFQAQDGKVWLGTSDRGAAWLMPDAARPDAAPSVAHWLPLAQLSHPWVAGIAQVRADQIWLASYGGGIISVAASDGRVLQTLRHDPTLASSLAHDSLKPLLLDRAGWLWVGTWGAGLQRMNGKHTMLRILRHSPRLPRALSYPDIKSILELANGQILFGGGDSGIDIFDRHQGLIGGYRKVAGQTGQLPDAAVLALAQTHDGAIWAGTRYAGVVRRPANAANASTWTEIPGLPDRQVGTLLVSRDGSLWAGTERGVARCQAAANAQRFEIMNDAKGKPMDADVNALAEDGQGRIWIGTTTGLWLKEPTSTNLIAVVAQGNQATDLVSDYIQALLFDSKGRLWVGTDKGLERLKSWDGKRAQFEHISAMLGQAGKAIGSNLLEDKQGRIWTDEGVIDSAPLRMIPVTRADGMDIGANWTGSAGKTRDGLLFFGGTKGVAIIDPPRYQPYDYVPPVVAVALSVNGQPMPLGSLAASKSVLAPMLTFTPQQRSFSLEFAALDYTDPKKNRYQYRLQGYDSEWLNADADHRSANYGNLPPGEYTLTVRGSNRLGVFSPNELSILVRVLPAWWQTLWFRALMLLLVGSAVYLGFRWRVAGLNKSARVLQKLVAARTADIVKLGEIGKELTSTLDTEQAFERVYKQISARLDAYVFLIGLVDEGQACITFVYKIENGQRLPNMQVAMSEVNRPAVWCVREQRELAVGNTRELLEYVSKIIPPSDGESTETVVYLPLQVEQKVIGCLSVQSQRPAAYSHDQLEFLRVLASYTAIALSNSVAHADLAKSHDELAQSHDDLAATHLHLQETQQQLLLQEKMAGLGTLTAGVAHEINNPTNFTHVAAQIQQGDIAEFEQFVAGLIEDDTDNEVLLAFQRRFAKLSGNVSTMLVGTERIKAIVKDLHSFTRHGEAERKSVHLSECVRSTVNLVRTSWLEKVEFMTEFTDDPELECWPALLNQVFMNLLVNACQAIDEKYAGQERGKVWLRLRLGADQECLELVVEDNGCGIDPAIQVRIMEPFFTTKEVGSGSGLGLSTAFGIVQKHGGSLEFTSTVGVGSCFVVRLPLA